jgi:hypothetical protein
MLRLMKEKPEVEPEKENAFKDIRELPWWQYWAELAGYTAAFLFIGEFLYRLVFA